jgi:hypothetical protein
MLTFLMNHHVHAAITLGLRLRGIDVLTAIEDGSNQLSDPDLLDRAKTLSRVLFSQDADLLQEAVRRQRAAEEFAGLIYSRQRIAIGTCVQDLELFASVYSLEDMKNRIEYLPL